VTAALVPYSGPRRPLGQALADAKAADTQCCQRNGLVRSSLPQGSEARWRVSFAARQNSPSY